MIISLEGMSNIKRIEPWHIKNFSNYGNSTQLVNDFIQCQAICWYTFVMLQVQFLCLCLAREIMDFIWAMRMLDDVCVIVSLNFVNWFMIFESIIPVLSFLFYFVWFDFSFCLITANWQLRLADPLRILFIVFQVIIVA